MKIEMQSNRVNSPNQNQHPQNLNLNPKPTCHINHIKKNHQNKKPYLPTVISRIHISSIFKQQCHNLTETQINKIKKGVDENGREKKKTFKHENEKNEKRGG